MEYKESVQWIIGWIWNWWPHKAIIWVVNIICERWQWNQKPVHS